MQTNIHRLERAEAKELADALESHTCRLMLDRAGQDSEIQREITDRLDRAIILKKRLGRMDEPATIVLGEPIEGLPGSLLAIVGAVSDLFGDNIPQDLGRAILNHRAALAAAGLNGVA